MKVRKFLYSMLLILVASFFVVQPVLAISQRQLEEFANNNIMFYDPGDTDTFDCYSTSATAVTETDNASHIWNWFVNANIPGVSDHAEVIAGILGNFKQEHSALDPFAYGKKADGSPNGFYGLYETNNSNFKKEFEEKFGSDKWGGTYDAAYTYSAIDFQLEFFVDPNKFNWNGFGFLNYLDYPTAQAGEDGAAAYAELAMVLIERPVTKSAPDGYTIDSVHDSGVIRVTKELYGDNTWNYSVGKPGRLVYARDFYNKFANSQILSSAETTVTGNDITIIGDETVTSIESSLTSTLSGVDIKTADNITAAAELVKNDSSIRQNVILSFDISKNLIGEDNLTSALTNLGSKKLFFVINNSLNTSDTFTNNEALIGTKQDKFQTIYISNQNEAPQKIAELFKKPIVNMCGEDTPTSSISDDELFPINFKGTNISAMPDDTTNIACTSGTGEIRKYYNNGSKKLRLCDVPGFLDSGSPIQVSSVAVRSFQKFFEEHDAIIYERFGVHLTASESFRTLEKQIGFWRAWCPKDDYPNRTGVDKYGSCLEPSKTANEAAYPGSSKHEFGLAVDIDVPVESSKNPKVEKYICKSTYSVNLSDPYNGFTIYGMKDTPSGSKNLDRGSTAFTKYLCDNLYKYGLRYTVYGEVWHIQWVGQGGHESIK